jgi:hypothetical protein
MRVSTGLPGAVKLDSQGVHPRRELRLVIENLAQSFWLIGDQ